MIGAPLPQRVAPVHAMKSNERVHDRVLESVTHVQAAGDVRRWNHDAVRLARPRRLEVAPLLPGLVPGLLDFLWIVGLVHVGRGLSSLASHRCAVMIHRPLSVGFVCLATFLEIPLVRDGPGAASGGGGGHAGGSRAKVDRALCIVPSGGQIGTHCWISARATRRTRVVSASVRTQRMEIHFAPAVKSRAVAHS